MLLCRARHVSFFCRRAAVFAYVDLTGEVLEMSSDVRDFIVAFAAGATVASVARARGVPLEQATAWAETLQRHHVLHGERDDVQAQLRSWCPTIAPWCAYLDRAEAVIVVAGRSLRDVPELVALSPWERRLWRAIDGERSVAEVAAAVAGQAKATAGTLRRVEAALARWTAADRQWTRLSPLPMSAYLRGAPRPPYLSSTMPYPALDDDAEPRDTFADGGAIDNRAYHRDAIVDVAAQFDDVETTLAHLFAAPHPALGGRTYAAALVDGLIARGRWPAAGERPLAVVEVGGGTGMLAEAALEALAARGIAARWRIVEISPAMRAAQSARLARFAEQVEIVAGDAETHEEPAGSCDVVIANEMIGDLRSELIAGAGPECTRAFATLRALGVEPDSAPQPFWLNSGALGLVERVARWLAPGGLCWVSEFGHRSQWPVESTHLDHAEVSIHFGLLGAAARRSGLQAEVVDVVDVIGLDPRPLALQTTATYFRNLRALCASRGVVLDKRAWTRDSLDAALGDALPRVALGNLRFAPMGERVMGLRPREFLALIGVRPAPQALAAP